MVFRITDGGLLETQYSGQFPDNGSGAIDIAVSDRDNIIFCSYDGVNIIEAVSTKTMERVATEMISGGTENEIAGLEYCHTYNLLLAAERYDQHVRVLRYDAENAVFTQNNEIEVPNITSGGILGLYLDEQEMRLYVSQSQNSSIVRYYDFEVNGNTVTLTNGGQIPIQWNGQSKIAVGIALFNDGAGTKYLYSAGYNHENPYEHPYLIRTSLSASNEVIDRFGTQVNPYAFVAGVDTDERTGYLYITTVGTSSIRVYDPNQWSADPNTCDYIQALTPPQIPEIAGPAGIAVGPNFFDPDRLVIHKKQIDPDPNICTYPETFVTYRTAVHHGVQDEQNVIVREFLPEESIFVSADPNSGYYNSAAHTYSWEIGDLPGLDPNDQTSDPNQYFEITVYITDTAEPAGYVVNTAEVESDSAYAKDNAKTSICCWAVSDRIYVDEKAAGHNSGVNWANAYRNLEDALYRAEQGCGSEIWVAEGVYSPGNAVADVFQVPDNVEVYGGFEGTETDRDQRNWVVHQTVISGYIDKDIFGNDVQNDILLKMGHQSRLDGLTVQGSDHYGIWGKNVDFTIKNCLITDNDQAGIYGKNGELTVDWCQINNSGAQGIYLTADAGSLGVIANSKIFQNQFDGIYAGNSQINIINSRIYQNGLTGSPTNPYYGINLLNPYPNSKIRNNTIVSNAGGGIRVVGGNLPEIRNCIIWDNADNQLSPFEPEMAAFNSCIQDCNDVNGNISTDPNFAYDPFAAGNTNFHLAYNSPCRDRGGEDTVTDPNEFDMDGETRVFGTRVDIGADEAVACDGDLTADDIYNPLDGNADGLVNYSDFTGLSEAWLSRDPNDPSIVTDPNCTSDPNYVDPATIAKWQNCWNPLFNLDVTAPSTYKIDLADLQIFWNDYWLWIACWKENEFLWLY